MNLSAYDEISPKIDKNKTWVTVNNHHLLSREIVYRKYYTIAKRYNINNSDYDYFIITLDDKPENRNYGIVKYDNYGRIKISINSIWNEIISRNYSTDFNISIIHTEHTDDGDIYKIDI